MSIQPDDKINRILKRQSFDYSVLDAGLAEEARAATAFILEKMKQTIANIVVIGLKLHGMKQSLPHGQFGKWVQAEFGWSATTESNYRAVADWLGGKTTIIVDLPIAPTAAYRLAAPSTPEDAREEALQRARAGEEISNALAVAIIEKVEMRNALKRKPKVPHRRLAQLKRNLADCPKFCPDDQRADLARELQEVAEAVLRGPGGSEEQSDDKTAGKG